jgi:hypothetical protein
MKILNYYKLLLVVCVFFSCGKNAKEETTEKSTTVAEKVKSTTSPLEKIRAINKTQEILKAKEPITLEVLNSWLPETVKDLKKTKGGAISQNGVIGINAEYLEQDNPYGKHYAKKVNILIIDGYGERGAIAVMGYLAIQQEANVSYDNIPVKEEFNSSNKTYTLSFFYNNRFGVELKAKGFEQQELWGIFKAFKLNTLN